jgi:ABC-type dipeptide/oligopeptide/nickel transport system ATPase component/ABC-type dipeptide/oligopeptide/nickel transport system permease subunit
MNQTKWSRFRSRKSAMVGLFVLLFVLGIAILAPWIAPTDPQAMNFDRLLTGPSWSNPLGTDESGRDVLSRLIAGSRIDLQAAALATLLASSIGVSLGLIVGFAHQRVDLVVMRIVEAVQSLPGIVVLTAVIAVVGRGIGGATIALGIALSLLVLFATRSEVRRARHELYTSSARVMGVSFSRILLRHILPNIVPSLISVITTVFGITFVALSSLSVLGLGAQPPAPSWGAMLQGASQNMNRQFLAVFPPGIAIIIVGLAAGATAEGIQFALGRGAGPHGGSLRPALPLRTASHAAPPSNDAPAVHSAAAPTSAQPLVLELRGLQVTAPPPGAAPGTAPVTIVHGLDLTIGSGEIVGLVGESGSGKTMTISSITGLLPAEVSSSADKLELNGQDLRTLSNDSLRRVMGTKVGMIFQNPGSSLDPTKRILPQLIEASVLHGVSNRVSAERRALELLDAVGIADPARVSRAWPHQLSGGMAQRVMIASALMTDPVLLLADEPTTALDVTVQAQVLDLLRSVRDRFGTAVLFITHDLAVVADLCDRVAVMQHGSIIEEADVHTLFASPTHEYTQVLLDVSGRDRVPEVVR